MNLAGGQWELALSLLALLEEQRQPGNQAEGLSLTLRLKIAQKRYIVRSLGPKALKYESLEPWGESPRISVLRGSYKGSKGESIGFQKALWEF